MILSSKSWKHLLLMIIGFVLYWLVCKLMPDKWWISDKGWFWWTVPFFGYYVYPPTDNVKSVQLIKTT